MKSNGTGMAASDERVDYVVVDQKKTQALKSTREAWSDGRQSTETENPSKGPKWPCHCKCQPTLQIPKLLSLFYTTAGCGLCFATVQLSRSTSASLLVCKGQWSFKATQLSLVYTAAQPTVGWHRVYSCRKECWARNKLYAVWKQVEWLDLSLGFDLSWLTNFEHSLPPIFS